MNAGYRPDVVGRLVVGAATTVRDAMQVLDASGLGIALVVDEAGRLEATVTDGDVRRAILAGLELDAEIGTLVSTAAKGIRTPISAPVGTDPSTALALMQQHHIRHLPLLDPRRRPRDLVVLEDLLPDHSVPLTAVVMAGGLGTRLLPLTERIPKPMLPVGERPLLELIVDQLRGAGIRRIHLTTHYLPETIADHFGDGRKFGVEIRYVVEEQPLGTAGALAAMETDEPLLVVNGDILTGVNFRAMLDFHREHRADLTVAVRAYEYQIPYGVVRLDGVRVVDVEEKPTSRVFVGAGIYLLQPDARRHLPENARCDMPELIRRLIEAGGRVVGFPVHEYWADIGRPSDYERVQNDARQGLTP